MSGLDGIDGIDYKVEEEHTIRAPAVINCLIRNLSVTIPISDCAAILNLVLCTKHTILLTFCTPPLYPDENP